MRKSVHIYPSPIAYQSRLVKEAKSLIKLGLVDEVELVGVRSKNRNDSGLELDRIIFRGIKLIFPHGNIIQKFLNYVHFILMVIYIYRKKQIEFMSCHSLLVLPIGVFLKKLGNTGCLIYEPHELETERVGLVGVSRKLTKILERVLIKYIDVLIVVSDPIKDWYTDTYGIENVFVVRNMPLRKSISGVKSNYLKDELRIPYDNLLFIYQGLIAKGRGLDVLLDTFKLLSPNKHIVFMGYGPDEKEVLKVAAEYSNVHFKPAVSPDEIIKFTSGADVGVNFIVGKVCLSYSYSLPNKFGEYILSGVPVLVSSSLEFLSYLVTHHNCGWSLNSDSSDLLLNFLENISFEDVEKMKCGVIELAQSEGWELEEIKFIQIYNYN